MVDTYRQEAREERMIIVSVVVLRIYLDVTTL